jgi:phosphotriesterase-related protein
MSFAVRGVSSVTESAFKGEIQTVTGIIKPEQLGKTLMHEHLLIDLNSPQTRSSIPNYDTTDLPVRPCECFKLNWGQSANPGNFRLNNLPILIEELKEMRAAGGQSLVELTVGGLRPDPEGLVALSKATGVFIIMGCGHYVHEYQDPRNALRTEEDFAGEMIDQITVGAWGTPIKAGIIGEIGCQSPWTEQEKRVMRGALLAQQQTGAALNVHPGRSEEQPTEVVRFVKNFGNPMDRLVISHIDRTIFEVNDLLRIADSGCILEFDLFGWETTNYWPNPAVDMPNDGARLKFIRALVDHGHVERILISHDICTQTRLSHFGGHGYQHIFANVLPLMRRRGFSEAQIETITVRNPTRLLAMPKT